MNEVGMRIDSQNMDVPIDVKIGGNHRWHRPKNIDVCWRKTSMYIQKICMRLIQARQKWNLLLINDNIVTKKGMGGGTLPMIRRGDFNVQFF